MSRSVVALGAIVGVVLLAGCATSEVDDYRSKANASCAAAKERLGKAEKPSTPAEAAKAAEREMTAREEAISYLSELVVPIHIEGATVVLDDLEHRQERAGKVKKAAEAKDESELEKLEKEERKELGLEAQRAKAVGLDDCAEL